MADRMWALTPSYAPAGGVVKILDYVNHALELGFEVVVACPRGWNPESPLWRMDAFAHLPSHPRVRWTDDLRIAPRPDDLVFFSWPSHIRDISPRLPHGFPTANVVHIVQNTRHANPAFAGGWGVRTLARPMTRIVINQQVRDAIDPFLNHTGLTEVIPLGHAADYFHRDRVPGLSGTITVGYTTWKSSIGDEVAEMLADDTRFAFRAVREPVDWSSLRDLYHGCDVFLCAPGPQEGFYLPGLEAMAAGCVVLTPDVEGNLAYAWFDVNCLEVPFEDAAATAARLREVVDVPTARVEALRAAGRERVEAHSLDHERAAFADLVVRLAKSDSPRVVGRPVALPGRRASDRFTLLTGVPRSGTTLATRLLDSLPDVIALGEPLRPSQLMTLDSTRTIVDHIEAYFVAQRQSAIEEGVVASKSIGGVQVDNYVAPDGGGLRGDVAERGPVRLDAPVGTDVHLLIKDLAMTAALLEDVARRFDVAAIVRNPVAVLASWETVDLPVHDGHAPHAEWFAADLARKLQIDDRRSRQLCLLDWFFRQISTHVSTDRVVRYEDVIATRGRALCAVVPAAESLDEDLTSRNTATAYTNIDLVALTEDVLSVPNAAWSTWYTAQDIRSVAQ